MAAPSRPPRRRAVQAAQPRAASRRRAKSPGTASAFTLLEVLVAVAVLALVYTSLAGMSMQGLRAEGDASRRLRASLLADRTLVELEAQMDLGEGRPESSETEEDEFTVAVEILPYALVLPEDPALRDRRRTPTASLLQAGAAGRPSALLEVRVRVVWTEGSDERGVSRTTWGIDREIAGQLLSSNAPQLLPSDGQETPEEAPEERVR